MKKFTIELNETACKWLEHVSELTRVPIESVIANGIYNQIDIIEDNIFKSFSDDCSYYSPSSCQKDNKEIEMFSCPLRKKCSAS